MLVFSIGKKTKNQQENKKLFVPLSCTVRQAGPLWYKTPGAWDVRNKSFLSSREEGRDNWAVGGMQGLQSVAQLL